MFCSNCGTLCADGQAFCPNCGNALQSANNQQTYSQQQPQYSQPQQPYGQPMYQQPTIQYPMAWYKFLIYFALFAGAVLNAIGGILSITGAKYLYEGENISELYYEIFEGLQAVDVIYGIVCIGLAIFGIYVRVQLANFKTNGPKMLNTLYALVASTGLLYVISVNIVVNNNSLAVADTEDITVSAISSLIVSVIMIIANSVYFKKRQHMFVN